MRILNIGSLNIDYVYDVEHFVERGETISSSGRGVFAGGKGLNQSVALGRAGAEVFHAGLVGAEGAYLCDLLGQTGVDTSHVRVLGDCPTGHAIIQRDAEGDNCIVLFSGANARVDKALVDAALEVCEKGDWVLLQNETGALDYAISEAKARGMKVVLNPSPVDGRLLRCPLDLVDMFILNEGEAMRLSGAFCHGTDLLAAMREKFPEAKVVLTLGERGSIAVDADGATIEQPAYRVEAIDTTAAGDTFTGFFLAQMAGGSSLARALKVASKASAIAVTRPGAAPSIPVLDEVVEALECDGGGVIDDFARL